MSGRLAGKVAVVTGAANGIGKGCAEIFSREGATVVGVDRDDCDLTDEAAVNALFARIGDEHGRIDALVNAAAFAVFAWIEDLSYADWRKTLTGELDIVFLTTRAAWPWLKASGQMGKGPSVINFASANARHALEGSPALAHCAGKGGVLAMTRQLAMEGAPHGIRANTIAPGFIKTAATAAHLAADPGFEQQVLAKNMLKRLGEPEDIAWCAVWLASDEARYVTGADVPVDAGATAW
ncbi:MAG: SDR family oxidoreductase [Sphingomonadales bacterium]|nr:SDR family oxidoreductase [Sphingomonadales bacterium]